MEEYILNQGFSASYDVVIIGAGNGGLVAATQLALEGKKVILFEQHNLPGGFAGSFVRGRFEFETSLHELCDYGPESNKGSIQILFEDLGIDIEVSEVPEAYRLILTDPEINLDVIIPFGVDAYIKAIVGEVPESYHSVKKFVRLCKEVNDALGYIKESRGNPDRDYLMKNFKNFLRTAAYSLDDVLNVLEVPTRAQYIIKGYWCYLSIPTSRMNFTIFAAMLYFFLIRGAFIPKYRSTGYTTALEKKILDSGGAIEYNTKVNKILVKDNQVVGIETNQGDKIETNYVISNASPTLVYNNLVYPPEEVPPNALKLLNARRHAISCFVVYLGLNRTAKELGLKEYSYLIFKNMNTEEIYESFKTLEPPIAQATICLNNAILDCSPKGTSILEITAFFLSEAWEKVKPEEYFKVKEKIAKNLILQFEKATNTKIFENIEEIEIATPQTFSRYTGTYRGVCYGYEVDPWDSTMPRLMVMKDEKFINGLEICGGFSFQGVSYTNSLLSGQITAFLTLQDMANTEEENV